MLLSGGLGACVLWGVVSQAAAHASVGGSDPQFSREQVRRIVLADIANAELRTGRVLTRARVTNISGDGATWQVDFRGTAASCGGWWCNLDSAGRYSFRNDALRGTTFSKPPPGQRNPALPGDDEKKVCSAEGAGAGESESSGVFARQRARPAGRRFREPSVSFGPSACSPENTTSSIPAGRARSRRPCRHGS